MVLEQTKNIYRDMVDSEGWEGKSEITIDSMAGLTLRVFKILNLFHLKL